VAILNLNVFELLTELENLVDKFLDILIITHILDVYSSQSDVLSPAFDRLNNDLIFGKML
tara:strand:- start:2487 stop:2666 length:180 start_codon:yes stop_codon:yes gene_type:complete